MEKTTFCDLVNRTWSIALTFGLCKRARGKTGLDLLNLEAEPLEKLLNSDESLVELLALLLAEQIQETGITRDDFENGFDREILGRALDALMEAILNFCRPERREAFRALLDRLNEAQTATGQMATEKIKGETGDKIAAAMLATLSGKIDRDLEIRIEDLRRPGTS